MHPFDQKKQHLLNQIGTTSPDNPDASPKGTLDVALLPLINLINSHPDMVTTSSCSGRVSVFLEGNKVKANQIGGKGGGGKWLFITHDPSELNDTWWTENLIKYTQSEGAIRSEENDLCDRYVLYKFEPMILHVKCRNHDISSKLYSHAMACGFRESGIGSNDLVGIRISIGLDVPVGVLQLDGSIRLLVSDEYIKLLNNLSKDMFSKNFAKMDQLYNTIRHEAFNAQAVESITETKEQRRQRKIKEGLERQKVKVINSFKEKEVADD